MDIFDSLLLSFFLVFIAKDKPFSVKLTSNGQKSTLKEEKYRLVSTFSNNVTVWGCQAIFLVLCRVLKDSKANYS